MFSTTQLQYLEKQTKLKKIIVRLRTPLVDKTNLNIGFLKENGEEKKTHKSTITQNRQLPEIVPLSLNEVTRKKCEQKKNRMREMMDDLAIAEKKYYKILSFRNITHNNNDD